MDKAQFMPAIKQICEEKGISEKTVFETIEAAMASAYRKDYGDADWKVRAEFDQKTGGTKFWRVFDVSEEVENENNQIDVKAAKLELKNNKDAKLIKEADVVDHPDENNQPVQKEETKEEKPAKPKKVDPTKPQEGDQIATPLETPADYGRIAAQTAKQVVIQRIREAERDVLYEEYKGKEGEVINGVVQQLEGRNVIIDLGRTNGIIFPAEQIPNERYYVGQRLKVYIAAVEKTSKAPLIALSRAHEGLIKRLFELEVPEINAGSVEIKGIAREAGRRTKMAVEAHQEGVDPVGSCVGQRGTRVQAVLAEIGDEKIDIIEYQKDPEKYIKAALSPAKVDSVKISKKDKTAKVQVAEDQLSLAIGKEGQNVRLASKLSGFEIDVEKDEKASKKAKDSKETDKKEEKPAKVEKKVKAETSKEEKPEEKKEELAETPEKTKEEPEKESK